ncbi:hypothetical protein O0L34_g15209 [Tuta absoluta]|nr:hypothetical protein O0L34_g15209 [Tuta absoluta]
MLRVLLFTTFYLALAKCEGVDFFQGEWTQVASIASAKSKDEVTCIKATFEVTHEHAHFDVIMKLNSIAVTEEPKLAIVAHTQKEAENALIDNCKDGKNTFFTVHRELTSNYRFLYIKNCGASSALWYLLAKQVATRAALQEFINSNEDLKDKYIGILCTSEVLQNPPSTPTFVEMTKLRN